MTPCRKGFGTFVSLLLAATLPPVQAAAGGNLFTCHSGNSGPHAAERQMPDTAAHDGDTIIYNKDTTADHAAGSPRTAQAARQALPADTLMARVFTYVQRSRLEVGSFDSEVYVRHTLRTRRKGIIMRYIPGMFRLEHGTNDYFGESLSRYQYNPPRELYKKDIASYNTMPYLRPSRDRWIGRYSLSVYEPSLFSDRILSPLHRRNRRFYRYSSNYSYIASGHKVTNISVRPRFPNAQLVRGSIDVDEESGQVRHIDFEFVYGWARVRVSGDMGPEGKASLLPGKILIESRLRLLGNHVDESFEAWLGYGFHAPETQAPAEAKASPFDLTRQSMLRIDTASMRRDRAFFDGMRPAPLLPRQQAIYDRRDSIARGLLSDTVARKKRRLMSTRTEDLLFDSHYIDIGRQGWLKLPPILTPAMFQWSRSKGISLQTRITFNIPLPNEGDVDFAPRVGYNFKQRQVYWRLPLRVNVRPALDATVGVEFAGGDHMYNSRQADEISNRLSGVSGYDSLISVFDSYDFHFYRDKHLLADFSLSPVVGMNVCLGLRYHRRSLIRWNALAQMAGMNRRLESLAPRINLTWTPAQYYYRAGRRRVPLHSAWPTFILDYERGLRSLRGHTHYERIEFDTKYSLPLYALRSVYLRAGTGFYTQRGADCFLDYDYFRNSYLPEGWQDEMSGQFQLLDSRWYNESRYYARFSAAYESPMLLFSRIKFLSRVVQKERVYANLLSVHALGFYSEWGYGVSTPFCDLAGFVSLAGHGQTGVGCKFVLRLFED